MSFFGSLFGGDQRKDIERAHVASTEALQKGYEESSATASRYGDEGIGYLNPFMQAGQRGQKTYEDSLGLNGAAGGSNALMAYQSGRNPYLDWQQDQAQRGLDRTANARGSLNSGANALAGARARMDIGYKDYSGWQDRLSQMGQQGQQAASTGAALRQNQGQYLGDLRSGYGQQLAGNEVNYGNAMASSRNIGINNLLGIAGLGVKAYGGK